MIEKPNGRKTMEHVEIIRSSKKQKKQTLTTITIYLLDEQFKLGFILNGIQIENA
jgi:hypothetical protein